MNRVEKSQETYKKLFGDAVPAGIRDRSGSSRYFEPFYLWLYGLSANAERAAMGQRGPEP